jgi:hypothetical protein
MKKIILALVLMVCVGTQLEAHGGMPRNLIREQPASEKEAVLIENDFSSTKYNVLPYAGTMFYIPAAGVAFRNETYDWEIDVKATSLLVASAGMVSASKIFSDAKNFNKEGLYRGSYFGVGLGAGVFAGLGGEGMIFAPIAVAKAFVGYQGKYGFIDAGLDQVMILPCPSVRVGIRF